MMRTRNKLIRLLLLVLFPALLVACTDETFLDDNRIRVEEGLLAHFELGFSAQKNKIESRSAQGELYENQVSNLYVFIFDTEKKGIVHYRHFFDKNEISFIDGDDLFHSGSVLIHTTSLNKARIVCLANLTVEGVNTSYTVTPEDMNNIQSLSELEAYVMKMNERTVERSTQFMMTGYAYDTKNPDNIDITIPGAEQGTAKLDCKLAPERTDAKVEFVVKTEVPQGKDWKDMDFRPRSWKVVNVPAQSLLLYNKANDADGEGCEYFTTAEMPFEHIERDENYLYKKGGYVFYMAENRKTAKSSISGDNLTPAQKYALREKRDKKNESGLFPDKPGQEYEQGDFTYAPSNATYVEMVGTLSYIDGAGYTVNADVTFTVHLGYANGDANDYSTLRNTHYTYNVTLRGVDDIIVEVTNEGGQNPEPRPGYEGSVVFSREGMHELDAHYDRELIILDRSLVKDMGWGVQTPFSRGLYKGSGKPEESGIYDYKWIKFAIYDDYNDDKAMDKYVKYPGDGNYKGAANGGSPSPSFPNKPNARLLDIHQLLERLKKEYDEGQTTGQVSISAFVDEYVYFTHPETGQEMLSEWRKYVEAEDRLLYFTNGSHSKYSPDGASSVIEAIQTFKQHSIRTVYNVNKSSTELPQIWGLESIMEGKRWKPGNVSLGNSTSNGRLNTLRCILGESYESFEGLKWTDVLNTSEHYELNPNYQTALYAVLMRNRDLNGDNIVQAGEIRWYLAAIDQLVDLYLGEYALDEEARLYPTNPADREGKVYWHYTSSSANGKEGNNPWVLWAEECAALGNYNASTGVNGGSYAYRCVRNLGIKLEDPTEEPTPLIPKVEKAETDGTYLIDVSNLSEKARRLSIEAGPTLGVHDDVSPQNRPFVKFRVDKPDNDYNFNSDKPKYRVHGIFNQEFEFTNDGIWSQYQKSTLPDGYRLPNLRELLIMSTRLPASAWKTYSASKRYSKAMYFSITSFSRFNLPEFKNRNGFRFNAGDGSLGVPENSGKAYVRGVKDVE